VKQEEMLELERRAFEKEKALEQAERFLEEDAAMFDEFLKDNDKASTDAFILYYATFLYVLRNKI